MKIKLLLFITVYATFQLTCSSLNAQTSILFQNFETSMTSIPVGWAQEKAAAHPSNFGWGFNHTLPNGILADSFVPHTYYAYVDDQTNPNNKVAYYTFDATPIDQSDPSLTSFTKNANVVVMFEGTAWEVADSTHYGSATNYILSVNPNYHYYKQIIRDMKALQARGIKVLWTVNDETSWNTSTPFTTYNGTALNATQFAAFVKANVIDSLGLDGIALDIEHMGSTSANTKYIALLKAFGAYFGPMSSNPDYTVYTAAIYDGAAAGSAIGKSTTVAAYFNYVEDMGYYENNTSRFNNWASVIGNSKVMDGIYEGYDSLNTATAYASWEPSGNNKAGVMVYAANENKVYTDSIFASEAPSNPNVLVGNNDTLYTPVFSCAGDMHVFVSFDLMFRKNNGYETASLCISTDGGHAWIRDTTLPNKDYLWQDSLIYDISSYAANQPNVKLAFTYFDGCPNSSKLSGAGIAIDNVDIYELPSATISANTTENVKCNGSSDGTATAIVSGGTSPYTYSWSGGAGTNAIATGLSAGTYTVTVTDKNGYTGTALITVTQPTLLSASGSVTSNATCIGNNGSASSTVTGGTLPYTYSWTGGGSNSAISGLSAGSYTLNVIDNNGCIASSSVTITQPALLSVSGSVTSNATCIGNNGSASSTVTGGTLPYTYSWTGGGSNSAISGLSVGTYIVDVTDNNGCTASSSVTITQTAGISSISATTSNVKCNGENNGSATATVSGGTTPYTYSWQGGGTSATDNGLSAGTYTLSVTDKNGCSGTTTAVITQPKVLTSTTYTDAATNSKDCDGEAAVTASGGTTPYTYSWSGSGATTDTLKNTCAGNYCCTITDNNGCIESTCVTIPVSTTGVADINNTSNINIYPQPNTGSFNIAGVVRGQVIELYNILGQQIRSVTADQANVYFNIANQADGVYLVRILNRDGSLIAQKKIIKTQ